MSSNQLTNQKKSNSLWHRISGTHGKTEVEKLNMKLIEIANENTDLDSLNKSQKEQLERNKIVIEELQKKNLDLENELESLKKNLKLLQEEKISITVQKESEEEEIQKPKLRTEKLKSISKENEKRRKKTLKLLKRNLSEILVEKQSQTPPTTATSTPIGRNRKNSKIEKREDMKSSSESLSPNSSSFSLNERKRKKTLKLLKKNLSEIIEEKKKPKEKIEKKLSKRNRKSTIQQLKFNHSFMEIPKESKSDFKILTVFLNDKQRNLFQKYTTDLQLSDQFKYYELYHKFFSESDEELKESLAKQLYNDFIDTNGENSISISQQDFKIITKLYQRGSPSSFRMVYRQVNLSIKINELKSIYF